MKYLFFILFISTFCSAQQWQMRTIDPYDYNNACITTDGIIYTSDDSLIHTSSDGIYWHIVRKFEYLPATEKFPFESKIYKIFINGKNELVIHYRDSLYISSDGGYTFNDRSYYPPFTSDSRINGFNKNIIFSKSDYSIDGGHTFNLFPSNDSLYKSVKYIDGLGNLYSAPSSNFIAYKWRIDDTTTTKSKIPAYVDSLGNIITYTIEKGWDYNPNNIHTDNMYYYIGSKFQDSISFWPQSWYLDAHPIFNEDIITCRDGLYRVSKVATPDYYVDSLTGDKYPKFHVNINAISFNFHRYAGYLNLVIKSPDGILYGKDYNYNVPSFMTKSDDNGYNWEKLIRRFKETTVKALCVYEPETVLLGAYGGRLYRGSDINDILIDKYFPGSVKKILYKGDKIWVLAEERGKTCALYKRILNEGNKYDTLDLQGLKPDMIAASKNFIAFTVDSNKVYTSVNGATFSKFSDKNILPEPEKSKITGIFIDDDQILIAATSNDTACVILSMNFDGSIDSTYKFNGGKGFSTFIKDGKGNIYAGGDIKGIYKFEIGAENWVRLPFGINKTFSLALDSADILYAGGIKQTGNTKYSAIYYSKNNGEDWSMYCSAFDSTSSENSDSLLHSINDIAASQTYIFAATDEGIYMAKSLEQIKIKQDDFIINHGFYLNQNYPNPFNPSTVISYDIPEASRVTLKVYDILGREVADLVNEFKEAGRYNVKFDASHLSTGIYIYQLRANDYVSVKKMSFVK